MVQQKAVVDGQTDHVRVADGQRVVLPADGWDDVVVEDTAGHRYVLVPEQRYAALERAERVVADGRAPVALTAREREVLQMVAEGCPGSVVAERLGLAPNTVAQHLAGVRRKYGVRSSAAAADAARADGLIR
ncbi:response regulator transcription factor [Kineococcus terrestris]|uniref:response regulator transcription factor n=1 Tax=Kineococcus terrestris TaxID=2044856 RepID=UPI0034DAF57F